MSTDALETPLYRKSHIFMVLGLVGVKLVYRQDRHLQFGEVRRSASLRKFHIVTAVRRYELLGWLQRPTPRELLSVRNRREDTEDINIESKRRRWIATSNDSTGQAIKCERYTTQHTQFK
jgi:hypothetical protein